LNHIITFNLMMQKHGVSTAQVIMLCKSVINTLICTNAVIIEKRI
jgi:hypothetical protein